MPIWTSNYKTVPQSFKNPGQGAFHFRDVKEAVEERAVTEHIWGQEETDLTLGGGLHKEGAARVMVTDEGTVSRGSDERVTSNTSRIGRVLVDLSKLSTFREQDGVPLDFINGGDYATQLVKKIQVESAEMAANGTPVDGADTALTQLMTVFDYDALVDIIQDQVLAGIKRYVTSPQVPNIADAGAASVREGWDDFLLTASAFEKLASTNVDEVSEITEESRTFNIFDSTDTDNTTQADTDSPTGDVVLETIEAVRIHGTTVTGAVYA